MKVDYLSIHFKTSIIPSRTKHESFDSFGSHAQLLQSFTVKFHIVFFECNEPILSIHIQKEKYPNRSLIQDQNNIRRTLLTKQKIWNCQQGCLFFFFKSKEFFLLYTLHRSPIQHWIKKRV